jgi:hypothetical protein
VQNQANKKNDIPKNNKKRNLNDALKLGAGMNDYHKDEAMFKVEEYLPFLRSHNLNN